MSVRDRANYGHGHVYPRPDGVRSRCGGARLCKRCMLDDRRRQDGIMLPMLDTTWERLKTIAIGEIEPGDLVEPTERPPNTTKDGIPRHEIALDMAAVLAGNQLPPVRLTGLLEYLSYRMVTRAVRGYEVWVPASSYDTEVIIPYHLDASDYGYLIDRAHYQLATSRVLREHAAMMLNELLLEVSAK